MAVAVSCLGVAQRLLDANRREMMAVEEVPKVLMYQLKMLAWWLSFQRSRAVYLHLYGSLHQLESPD